ncbi:MAG: HAD family phosphatase [Methylohalobius sp.]|nr:HAD family phosphatase [Methylohalobius sp.]
MPIYAVVLDLDGVILDSETTYRQAWRIAAQSLGFTLNEDFLKTLSGLSIDAVGEALRQELGAGFDPKRFHALSTQIWEEQIKRRGLRVKPGYFLLLAALHKLKLPYALATNSHRLYAENCLKLSGVRQDFPLLVTRSEVKAGKPAPDVFLEAAKRLACPPASCLAVEDSEAGLIAAHRAGMQPVWIPDAAPVPEASQKLAFARFSSLGQLAQALPALCLGKN